MSSQQTQMTCDMPQKLKFNLLHSVWWQPGCVTTKTQTTVWHGNHENTVKTKCRFGFKAGIMVFCLFLSHLSIQQKNNLNPTSHSCWVMLGLYRKESSDSCWCCFATFCLSAEWSDEICPYSQQMLTADRKQLQVRIPTGILIRSTSNFFTCKNPSNGISDELA